MSSPAAPPDAAAATPLRQLVYASTAHVRYIPKDLEDILLVSHQRNRAAGVTGLLVYYTNHFIQCLEGAPEAVAETLARIRRDPRHVHLRVLLDQPVARRSFPAWDMACSELSESHWLELATVEWEMHRLGPPPPPPSPGLALLERVWQAHGSAEPMVNPLQPS